MRFERVCGFANFIVATSDPLGLLADNGGPTQTMLPLLGGAAICAGSVAFLPDGVTRDQRGFPRVGAGDRRRFRAAPADGVPVLLSPPVLALLAGLLAMFAIRRLKFVTA
jgi:hypothetical protein